MECLLLQNLDDDDPDTGHGLASAFTCFEARFFSFIPSPLDGRKDTSQQNSIYLVIVLALQEKRALL